MSTSARPTAAPRRRWAWLIPVLIVAVPILELYVVIQVGQAIGVGWTLLLLLAGTLLGGWLMKREGIRTWRAAREAREAGRLPSDQIADGVLILLGGLMLLLPGFVLDAVGLLLVLPLTRPLLRRPLAAAVARQTVPMSPVDPFGRARPGFTQSGFSPDAERPGAGPQGPVVRGEVVDD